MQGTLEALQGALTTALGDRIKAAAVDRGQLTLELDAGDLIGAATRLRDDPALAFTIMVDLLGIDYQGYAETWEGARYAVVYNLLSITHNNRVRLRVFCADDAFPAVESAIGVWPAANWY